MKLTRNHGCQPGVRISACGPFSPLVAIMCSPASELVPYILLSTAISSESTWTYEVAAKQINAITTNTALSDSESVRKFGRARLTNRPRMLGATAARTKYKGATITQNIGPSREPRGAPNVQQPTTAEVLRHSATIARKPGKLRLYQI